MRRFIYLDTDTLNSYLAQMFDGLIQGKSEESEDKRGIEKQNGIKTTALGELALKLWGKGVDASFEAAYERLKTVARKRFGMSKRKLCTITPSIIFMNILKMRIF